MENLTDYEKDEIKKYKRIYYRGEKAKKVSHTDLTNIKKSFDDEKGFYKIIPNDHLHYRYEIISYIGRGHFGKVVKGLDHKTNQYVAIKILRSGKKYFEDGKYEIEMLRHIRDNIRMKNNFLVKHVTSFIFRNHLCITFDCLSSDVKKELTKNNLIGFDICRAQKMSKCLIQAVHNLHKANLIHTDVKPKNVAFKKPGSSSVQLIDFGCCLRNEGLLLGCYMQTRYYRAPEIILRQPFDEAIDVWSVGCTIYEMIMGQPLFNGRNESDMIVRMIEVLGKPPPKLVQTWFNYAFQTGYYFNSDGQPKYLTTRYSRQSGVKLGANGGQPGSREIRKLLENCNCTELVNFLECCLQWDPSQRIKASQAIHHPWTIFKKIPTISDDIISSVKSYSSVDVSLISTAFKTRNCDVYDSVRRRIKNKHFRQLEIQEQDNQVYKAPKLVLNLDPKRPRWRDDFDSEMLKLIPRPNPKN